MGGSSIIFHFINSQSLVVLSNASDNGRRGDGRPADIPLECERIRKRTRHTALWTSVFGHRCAAVTRRWKHCCRRDENRAHLITEYWHNELGGCVTLSSMCLRRRRLPGGTELICCTRAGRSQYTHSLSQSRCQQRTRCAASMKLKIKLLYIYILFFKCNYLHSKNE